MGFAAKNDKDLFELCKNIWNILTGQKSLPSIDLFAIFNGIFVQTFFITYMMKHNFSQILNSFLVTLFQNFMVLCCKLR